MTTRRDFSIGLLAAAALSGLKGTSTALGAEKRADWKPALGLNGFASGERKYEKKYPLEKILKFASKVGFEGIELVDGWPSGSYPKPNEKDRIDSLKRLYDGYDLKVFSIQTGGGGAFSPDPGERKKWVKRFSEWTGFATAMGCDHIGVWPGGGLREQSIDQAIDRLSDSFRQAGDIAGEAGILAAFEIEPPFVFNTEDHLKRILEKVNHSAFKTIYDPSHFDLMNGSTGKPHEMLERIGVENVGYVHLTDTDGTLRDGGTSRHLPWGEGHVDTDATFETLRKGGFAGWIMIDGWEIPDPYEAGRKGIEGILGSR